MTKLVLSDKATAALERLRLQSLQGVSCGYCKDCKWWRREQRNLAARDWGGCHRWEEANSLFEVAVFEGFGTHEDFGCVQFEPKE